MAPSASSPEHTRAQARLHTRTHTHTRTHAHTHTHEHTTRAHVGLVRSVLWNIGWGLRRLEKSIQDGRKAASRRRVLRHNKNQRDTTIGGHQLPSSVVNRWTALIIGGRQVSWGLFDLLFRLGANHHSPIPPSPPNVRTPRLLLTHPPPIPSDIQLEMKSK